MTVFCASSQLLSFVAGGPSARGRKTRGSGPAIHGTRARLERFFVDTRPKAGHKRY